MKNVILIIVFLLLGKIVSFSQNQFVPTAEVLNNTLFIVTNHDAGSSFLVEVAGVEYVVTARHLFKENIGNGDRVIIKLGRDDLFEPFSGIVYLHENREVDIAVIKLANKIGVLEPVANDGGYSIGQESYFFGFPYMMPGSRVPEGRIPFVKKAIISAFIKVDGLDVIAFDGHNNPGFSGGPIITYDYSSSKKCIIGVVSSYHNHFNKTKIKTENDTIPFEYIENSGIFYAYPSKYYLEIIENID